MVGGLVLGGYFGTFLSVSSQVRLLLWKALACAMAAFLRGLRPLLRPAGTAAAAASRPTMVMGGSAARALSSSCSGATRAATARRLLAPLPTPCPTALITARHSSLAALRRASAPARVRFLSTTPPHQDEGAVGVLQRMGSWVRQNPTVVMVVVGMTAVMYGFYRGSVRLMKFFFNVSDKPIFTLGFMAGLFAMLGITGSMFWASRRLSFHVDDIYKAALRELRKYEVVTDKLGGAYRPGGFRGYSVESLSEAVAGSETRARSSYFEAPARRVQMMFMLRGLDRDAMVSLEAYKRTGSFHFEMLSLDLVAKPAAGLKAEHLFICGESDHILFQEMNEFLDAARESGRPERTMDEAMAEG